MRFLLVNLGLYGDIGKTSLESQIFNVSQGGSMQKDMIGFGLAGNFAHHLEQAGEAKDFIACENIATPDAPKGIFPFYIPHADGVLGRYCVDSRAIILPENPAKRVQAEPEIGLECAIIYENVADTNNTERAQKRVVRVEPKFFMACNDTSVRDDPTATKLSQKKNFSAGSKGVGEKIAIDRFCRGGVCDSYAIASFIRHANGSFQPYGEYSFLTSYSYFHERLLEWIAHTLNTQTDCGVLEDLPSVLERAGYPTRALFLIGATCYMQRYERYRLESSDEIAIVAFPHTRYTPDQVRMWLDSMDYAAFVDSSSALDGVSLLRQIVRKP